MTQPMSKSDPLAKTGTRDGMIIDWDEPIEMGDGVVLRADVYRPVAPGKYPASARLLYFHRRGPFFHDHPQDRPASIFETVNTLHCGASRAPYVLLPIIPAKE